MKKAISLFLAVCLAALMFVAVSAIVSSVNNGSAVVCAAADEKNEYDLDWDALEADGTLTEQTVTVTDVPVEGSETGSLTAPIAVLAVAAIACVGLGAACAVITVRRKGQ